MLKIGEVRVGQGIQARGFFPRLKLALMSTF